MLNVIKLNVIMLNFVMLSVVMLSFFFLSVVMLSAVMLNVVMLSIVTLSIVAPFLKCILPNSLSYYFSIFSVKVSNLGCNDTRCISLLVSKCGKERTAPASPMQTPLNAEVQNFKM
jgi:hypothetical protein